MREQATVAGGPSGAEQTVSAEFLPHYKAFPDKADFQHH